MSTGVFLIATYYYCGMCSRKNSKSSYMCNCSNKVIHLNGLQIFDFKMCTYSLLIICQYVENAKCFLLHFSYHVKHGLVQILCPSLTIFPHYLRSLGCTALVAFPPQELSPGTWDFVCFHQRSK